MLSHLLPARLTPPRALPLSLLVAAFGFATVQPSTAQSCASGTPPSILTAQYGNLRQGYNASESLLTSTCLSGTVTISQPSWSPLLVESGPSSQTNRLEAQPLYVSQISRTPALNNCPNPCNMVVAVTLSDSVYAWNADTGATIWSDCQGTGCTGTALWASDCGTGTGHGPAQAPYAPNALPFAGIVSTPVIDTVVSPPVMYVTSLAKPPLPTVASSGGSTSSICIPARTK
jgi:hypothetical protein